MDLSLLRRANTRIGQSKALHPIFRRQDAAVFRFMFMPTGTAQTSKNGTASASASVNKQAPLQICTRLYKFVGDRCKFAERPAYLQTRVFICRSACICAQPSVYLHPALQVCTTPCSFAADCVYTHRDVFTCTRLCMCAQPRVYLQVRPARLHSGVFICKRLCICAERHACLQALVHVCRASCLFARQHAVVDADVLD